MSTASPVTAEEGVTTPISPQVGRCAVCLGSIHRRTTVIDDPTREPFQPWLHLYPEDWQDNPHHVVFEIGKAHTPAWLRGTSA